MGSAGVSVCVVSGKVRKNASYLAGIFASCASRFECGFGAEWVIEFVAAADGFSGA
jgi:hypothetical protein